MGFNFEKLNELSNDRSKEVMRKAGRIIRDRHSRIPDKYKKIDCGQRGCGSFAEQHKEVERRLFPLRLNKTTVIYVTKDKQNEAYAAKARKRMGIAEPKKPFVDPLSEENITKLYKEEKIPPRRMAEMLDVSVRTIYLRLAKYGLTKVKCR